MSVKKHELIGIEIEVIDSKNNDNISLKGKIIDETKNTITIKDEKIRKLIKDQIRFKVINTGEIINGLEINYRPEERTKRI